MEEGIHFPRPLLPRHHGSYITTPHLSYVHRQQLHGDDVQDALQTVNHAGDHDGALSFITLHNNANIFGITDDNRNTLDGGSKRQGCYHDNWLRRQTYCPRPGRCATPNTSRSSYVMCSFFQRSLHMVTFPTCVSVSIYLLKGVNVTTYTCHSREINVTLIPAKELSCLCLDSSYTVI